jgi:alpha-glucosidase (family GH31 glycosyl hydrolase)
MLGDDLLVAPVTQQGAQRRRVYLPQLPAGEQWFDFYTRAPLAAGAEHEVDAPLHHLPLFARAGAQIPVAKPQGGALPQFDDPVVDTLVF